MAKNLRYLRNSDEEVAEETDRRLKGMKELLREIRDLLKSASGVD